MSKEPEEKKIPQGRIARITRIATLNVGLATELFSAAGRVVTGKGREEAARRFHEQSAQKLLKALGQMKGLPMKLGQMITYLDDYIPENHRAIYRDALTTLQTKARPIRWKQMSAVIKGDFGKDVSELYGEFKQEPMAAASIGQVYSATLPDGHPVAVKVQYPGIAEAIKNDLKNVQTIKTAIAMVLSKFDVEHTIKEISDRMLEECDYGYELCSHEEFYSVWNKDPDVVIPRIHGDLSSEHVITMDFIEGQSFAEVLKSEDQDLKNKYGVILFRYVFKSLYGHGLVNGDPHPGNFLFLEDGPVAFFDYGCVQRYDEDTINKFSLVRQLVVDGKRGEDLKEAMNDAYGFPENLDEEEFAFLEEFLLHAFQPLIAQQPFQLNRKYTEKLSDLGLKGTFLGTRKAFRKGVTELKGQGLAFLSRIHSGLMNMLANLNASADWPKIMEEIDREIEEERAARDINS